MPCCALSRMMKAETTTTPRMRSQRTSKLLITVTKQRAP